MKIAVAGGTGVVGQHVARSVRSAGHEPVVLARSTGVDLTTDSGVTEAVRGVEVIIDTSNVTTSGAKKSVAFFEAATTALIEAAGASGAHLVALSIVGIDRVPFGYYDGKLRQEQLLEQSGRSVGILRATQFHEFAGQILNRVPGPIAMVPMMRIRPVAAREVADVLVDLAMRRSTERTEIAGPQEEDLPDMVRRLLRAQGSHKRVVALRLPGRAGRAMASGGNLPTGLFVAGKESFDDWLRNHSDPHGAVE